MCTMYPFGARFFAKIRLSIRRFTYVRFGPKRNSNCVQLMQFYGVGALLATIINKRFYYFKMKAVYVTNEDVEGPSTISTRWISGLLFFYQTWRAPALQQKWHNFRKFTIRDPLSFRFKQAFVLDLPVFFWYSLILPWRALQILKFENDGRTCI